MTASGFPPPLFFALGVPAGAGAATGSGRSSVGALPLMRALMSVGFSLRRKTASSSKPLHITFRSIGCSCSTAGLIDVFGPRVPRDFSRKHFVSVRRVALALVAAWCFLVAAAGGGVGLVLGNIRLPVIILAATNPAAGAGANIGVSGAAALTAALAHIRAGRIDWRLVAWLTPPSMAGAVVGGYVSGKVPKDAFLATIGVVLLLMAVDLLRRRPPAEPRRLTPVETVLVGGGIGGLILGSLRLPAMLRMGEPLAAAIGTNVTVGFFVGAAGVAGHVPGGVDWTLLAVGDAASIPGALLGSRLTRRLPEAQLKQALAAILVVAGVAMLVEAIV